MRFNSLTKENEKGNGYSIYILYAILGAIICSFFIRIIGKVIVLIVTTLFKFFAKYWYLGILLLLIIIFLVRKRRRRKKEK